MKNKKVTVVFIAVAIFVIIIVALSNFTYKSKIIVGGKTYNVQVAETQYFLEKGLSGHKPLQTNEGMFFIFQKPGNYGFWMKDMSFPLDIVWIGGDFRVTHIEKAVAPETYPKVFYPGVDSVYVLEFASGQSDAINLKIGDYVNFERKASKNS